MLKNAIKCYIDAKKCYKKAKSIPCFEIMVIKPLIYTFILLLSKC